MAFNISYVYHAIDKFTGPANKIARSINKIVEKSKRANASIKQLGRGIRDVGVKMTAFATTAIGFLGFSMLRAASDAEESASKFNTVFSSISKSANKTAKELSRSFGLSRTEAKELLGDTGDLLTGFGFTQESALDLSTQVQKLAVDLASFTNFSGGAVGASKALTKALLGERESVKSLGISILEEDVKARVKQLVIVERMTFASKRQAKAFATLQLAQEQSKNAIGDFARTQDGFANKTRIMSAAIKDLKERLGEQLLPMASKLVSKITKLVRKFEDTSPKVKKLILVIGGLIAVAGPLLLIFGGLVIGIGALLSPIGLAVAAIAGMIATLTVLAVKYKSVGSILKSLGSIMVSVFKIATIPIRTMFNLVSSLFDKLMSILGVTGKVKDLFSGFSLAGVAEGAEGFAKGLAGLLDGSAGGSAQSGGVATQSAASRAVLDGIININAPPGVVKNTNMSVAGAGGNLGMSMIGAGG